MKQIIVVSDFKLQVHH